MVEEIATVVEVETGGVWLQTKVVSSCQSCSAQDSCTSGVVAKAMTRRDYRFFLPHPSTELLVGQQVRIGIAEDILVKSALLVYLVPLLMFIGTLGLAYAGGWSEAVQLISGLAGGFVGMLMARQLGQGVGSVQQQVHLLAILPSLAIENR